MILKFPLGITLVIEAKNLCVTITQRDGVLKVTLTKALMKRDTFK